MTRFNLKNYTAIRGTLQTSQKLLTTFCFWHLGQNLGAFSRHPRGCSSTEKSTPWLLSATARTCLCRGQNGLRFGMLWVRRPGELQPFQAHWCPAVAGTPALGSLKCLCPERAGRRLSSSVRRGRPQPVAVCRDHPRPCLKTWGFA